MASTAFLPKISMWQSQPPVFPILLRDWVFTEVTKFTQGLESGPLSSMSGVLIGKGNGGTDMNRRKTTWKTRQKMAIDKLRRDAWDCPLPHGPGRNSTILAS